MTQGIISRGSSELSSSEESRVSPTTTPDLAQDDDQLFFVTSYR
mgnify:CR=1 FL=1